MAVVMVIIGVLTAVAIPNISAYQAVEEAKSNVQIVASALRDARTRAVRTGRQFIVVFNPDPGEPNTIVRIIQDNNGDREEDAGDNVEDVTLARVRRAGVNPYGREVSPFPDATRATDTDPSNPEPALGNGDVPDGADFPDHFDLGVPAVGFTSAGLPFEVTPTTDAIEVGTGGGAYYMTDGRGAVFAAILLPLGEVRVRAYDPTTDTWR